MRPDPVELGAYLSSWLGPTTVTSLHQTYPGNSRASWIVQTDEHGGLVVRVDHPGGPLVPIPLELEYRVYERLWPTAIPVAEPLFFAEGTRFADGRPHMVRRLVDGSPQLDGLTGGAGDDPGLRRAVCYEMAEKLALVHTLDWRAAGLDEVLFVPASAETALRRRDPRVAPALGREPDRSVSDAHRGDLLARGGHPAGSDPARPAEGQQRHRRGDLEGRPHRRAVRLGARHHRRPVLGLGVLTGAAHAARHGGHARPLRRAQRVRDRPRAPGVGRGLDPRQGRR